jgi:hypothetical protein
MAVVPDLREKQLFPDHEPPEWWAVIQAQADESTQSPGRRADPDQEAALAA